MRQSPTRLLSLDVFRGITIAFMIFVNNPGSVASYPWVQHVTWDGCNLADLVFPFFLFIVGVSVAYVMPNQLKPNEHLPILTKIIKRTLIIFSLGLFLNAFPFHFEFATLRVFGVLQRIAVCYFFSAILALMTTVRIQTTVILLILIGYQLMMLYIPVPLFGSGQLTPAGNLAAYIDRSVFSSFHLYGKVFDPEGILTTLPAIATVLLGNLTGYGLRTRYTSEMKFRMLLATGAVFLVLGWFWGFWFPINKMLWTSSFVLWTAGWALLVLAGCYGAIEVKHWKTWSRPFEIFGLNAIAVYFLHIFLIKVLVTIPVFTASGAISLRDFLSQSLFGWTSPPNASLLYAMTSVLFWWTMMWLLYRKKIFIKV